VTFLDRILVYRKGKTSMEIMLLSSEEIPAAIDLVWAVFDEFEGPDYSPEGVEEFRKSVNQVTITEMVEHGVMRVWGCKVNGQLAGVIAMRGTNHISLLFVRKENHRQGIARKLFDNVVKECRKNEIIKRITVNSSPYAVEAYRRLGFIDTDSEQTTNGIRFTPMEYVLPVDKL
jgi:ribosomal protein S18 acetylase RimI-like enzyme